MFGLLFGSRVNDDAIRLKTHLNLMVARYLHLPVPQLRETVKQEYGKNAHIAQDVDGDVTVEIAHDDLPNFKIWIDGKIHRRMNVQGRGPYRGFLLKITAEGRSWTIQTAGDEAEPDARRLASLLERKFKMHKSQR